ncbi:MAG TPA: hypothetical protein VKB67_12000 [Rhizomicrobium sp.]|nr:hypothetical protein [Rhizomicrobium sp.]
MGGENLTGVWQGLFSYTTALRAGQFSATLIETAHQITGSTSEIWASGPRAGETVLAMVCGHRSDKAVSFIKRYEGPEKPNHSVVYEGILDDDFLEIEGRWFIPGSWAGRFLMIRSGGRQLEVAREAFERVGN